MRVVGWFQIVVGVGIISIWPVLVVAGEVPELAAGQLDIWFHMAAEVLTGLALVVVGRLLLRRGDQRSRMLASLALGALAYTGINSAGYYAESSEWGLTVALVLVAAAAVWAFTVLARVSAGAARRVAHPAQEAGELVS